MTKDTAPLPCKFEKLVSAMRRGHPDLRVLYVDESGRSVADDDILGRELVSADYSKQIDAIWMCVSNRTGE